MTENKLDQVVISRFKRNKTIKKCVWEIKKESFTHVFYVIEKTLSRWNVKAFSYNINAPLRMRTPQEGSAPQGGVAAARKVGLRPSKIEGMGKWEFETLKHKKLLTKIFFKFRSKLTKIKDKCRNELTL